MNKSSTKTKAEEQKISQAEGELAGLDRQMEQALVCLQYEKSLETSAHEYGAVQRYRGIQNAVDLLRIVLAYSTLDYSLRGLGIWCVLLEIANISKTALLNRLRGCHLWLGYLVARALMQRKVNFPTGTHLKIKLVDATVVSQPGSTGTDWRLHVGFDLLAPCLDWVKITTGKGAENLNRFTFGPGDLCIADRAYAVLSNILSVIAQQAWFIVRIGWRRQPGLRQAGGQVMDIIAWLKQDSLLAQGQPFETLVWLPNQATPLRLIARAIPEQEAEEARRRLRKEASKKGRTIDARSLVSAGFVMVLTNLPATTYPALSVLGLYRFRWQIELAFKRLKSLTGLDHLRAKDPRLALTYLYGKLLGAILLDCLVSKVRERCPDWFTSEQRPISLWRLTDLLWQQIRLLMQGHISLAMIFDALPRLQRFLCDEPRKRKSQFVSAQSILGYLVCA